MSRERRFYVPALGPDTVRLSPEQAHHLIHVLRLRVGSEVSLFDGKGRAARARIQRVAGGDVDLLVLGPEPSRESPLSVTLAVAPPRGDRMSFLIEKLTELGVSRLIPLETDRGRSGASLERWQRIAVEACKQSGRSRTPRIEQPRPLEDILEEPGLMLVAHPGAPPLTELRRVEEVVALVGPEGGWSEEEIGLVSNSRATLFGLGPRVLRTETAAMSVATLLQYLAGDLGRQ